MSKGMSREKILHMVERICAPAAASLGLELWGIELTGMGRPLVRIFVDTAPETSIISADAGSDDLSEGGEGVTVNQCSELSRLIGLALEVEDLFADAWELEVSSPGLERTFFQLAQLAPYLGRDLDVTLQDSLSDPDFAERRKFRGRLIAVGTDDFILRVETPRVETGYSDVTMPWSTVRRARLIHIFPDTSKPGSGKASKTDNKGGGNA